MLFNVALKSLVNRKGSALLTLFTLTLSLFVLLTIEDIRHQSKQSFSRAVSGVDLIVGAPTGQLNLTLASVFGIGYLTNSVEWQSYEKLEQHPQVDWLVPISLGDSHKGNRVIGTNSNYFELVKYGNKQNLNFAEGRAFIDDAYIAAEVVLGGRVANELGYQLGDEIILSHGLGVTSFQHHDQVPFVVSGILELTGTPTDSALFVSLSGMVRMHDDVAHVAKTEPVHKSSKEHDNHDHDEHSHAHESHDKHNHDEHSNAHESHDKHNHDEHSHAHESHDKHSHDEHSRAHESHAKHEHDEHSHEEQSHSGHDHEGHIHNTEQVSAVLVGVKAKYATLMVQKYVNDFTDEPLMAVLPGVALTELWRLLSKVETVLLVIAILVLISSLFGMCAMLLSSMQERVREIAVFRALGASKSFIFWLIQLEVLLLITVASTLALVLGYISHWLIQPLLLQQFGLAIEANLFTEAKGLMIVGSLLAAFIVGLIPAILAYRRALVISLK